MGCTSSRSRQESPGEEDDDDTVRGNNVSVVCVVSDPPRHETQITKSTMPPDLHHQLLDSGGPLSPALGMEGFDSPNESNNSSKRTSTGDEVSVFAVEQLAPSQPFDRTTSHENSANSRCLGEDSLATFWSSQGTRSLSPSYSGLGTSMSTARRDIADGDREDLNPLSVHLRHHNQQYNRRHPQLSTGTNLTFESNEACFGASVESGDAISFGSDLETPHGSIADEVEVGLLKVANSPSYGPPNSNNSSARQPPLPAPVRQPRFSPRVREGGGSGITSPLSPVMESMLSPLIPCEQRDRPVARNPFEAPGPHARVPSW